MNSKNVHYYVHEQSKVISNQGGRKLTRSPGGAPKVEAARTAAAQNVDITLRKSREI